MSPLQNPASQKRIFPSKKPFKMRTVIVLILCLCIASCTPSFELQSIRHEDGFSRGSLIGSKIILLPMLVDDDERFYPECSNAVLDIVRESFPDSEVSVQLMRCSKSANAEEMQPYWYLLDEAEKKPFNREAMRNRILVVLREMHADFALLVNVCNVEILQENWDEEDMVGDRYEYWRASAHVVLRAYLISLGDGSIAWMAQGKDSVSKENQVLRWSEVDGSFFQELLVSLFFNPIVGSISGEEKGFPDPTEEAICKVLRGTLKSISSKPVAIKNQTG